MTTRLAHYCDGPGCDARNEGGLDQLRSDGWYAYSFVPKNSKPRDVHFCSDTCTAGFVRVNLDNLGELRIL
jgi:hypothetical protein